MGGVSREGKKKRIVKEKQKMSTIEEKCINGLDRQQFLEEK